MSKPSHSAMSAGAVALLATALCWLQGAALASDADRELPANIEADRVEIDNQNQRSVYIGNVVFTQGSTRVSGERITLQTDRGEVRHLLIEGRLASFQELSNSGVQIRAEGRLIEYDAAGALLRLEGEASLSRPGETFASERILYHTDTEVVRAGSESGERVRITIVPGSGDGG